VRKIDNLPRLRVGCLDGDFKTDEFKDKTLHKVMLDNFGPLTFWDEVEKQVCPTQLLIDWLASNQTKMAYLSTWIAIFEPAKAEAKDSIFNFPVVSHFELYIQFESASDALLFKLAWGGK
jgi:hypothetical protein